MRVLAVVVALMGYLSGAEAFVMPASNLAIAPVCAASVSASTIDMTSANKKAKAAVRKQKTSRAVTKRFKATSTGKLLRHKAFKAHILTKKHPQRKQSLRRVGQVHEGQLQTMQKLMGVVPKRS